MEAEKNSTIGVTGLRLFGVDIVVEPVLLEDTPVQESDQKVPEATATAAESELTVEKEAKKMDINLPLVVYNPTPLRCVPPTINLEVGSLNEAHRKAFSSQKRLFQESGDEKRGKSKSLRRKRKNVVSDDNKGESVKRRRKNSVHDGEMPKPEDTPIFLQEIVTDDGSRPVFLYWKELEQSDVKSDQNRLFLTRSGKLMEFLTDVEREGITDNIKGMEVVGVDSQGKLYKLHLKKWPSLKMLVLNTDWTKLVLGNSAGKGDLVELWGYRSNGQLCLAAHFRKCAATAEAQRDAVEGPSQIGGC